MEKERIVFKDYVRGCSSYDQSKSPPIPPSSSYSTGFSTFLGSGFLAPFLSSFAASFGASLAAGWAAELPVEEPAPADPPNEKKELMSCPSTALAKREGQ